MCCDRVRHFIKIPGNCINICRIGAWRTENYSQNKLLVLPNKYGCLSTNDTQTLKKYYVNHMLQLRNIHLFNMFKMPQMAYPTNPNYFYSTRTDGTWQFTLGAAPGGNDLLRRLANTGSEQEKDRQRNREMTRIVVCFGSERFALLSWELVGFFEKKIPQGVKVCFSPST